MMRVSAVFIALLGTCSKADPDTPVAKVIQLLEDLHTDVELEGVAEAQSYDNFACFCKSTTEAKSTDITTERDDVNSYSASLQSDTEEKNTKQAEVKKRGQDAEQMNRDLADTESRFQKETDRYNAKKDDLTKAISSLTEAMKSMEGSKPDSAPASFLAVRRSVEQGLKLAGVLRLVDESKRKDLHALLQTSVDPKDPIYRFHSQSIIDTLQKLKEDFEAENNEHNIEWAKTKQSFEDSIDDLNTKIGLNKAAMDQLSSDIETLKGEIASTRRSLVIAEGTLKDLQLYMKDLTAVCETRAQDWDQRSQMRSGELSALAGALSVIKNEVSHRDSDVNARAFVQHAVTRVGVEASAVSFVQEVAIKSHAFGGSAGTAALASQSQQKLAVDYLLRESSRLHSAVLSSVAAQVRADPFLKVKTLIQKLIERLLSESTSEATKKGFCDEQLGKNKQEREYRYEETQTLTQDIQKLELKEEELTSELSELADSINGSQTSLSTAEANRQAEKQENHDDMKTARAGLKSVKEAITILQVFYKNAAKASVLLQASPVDEDTSGAGFAGAYQGKQESSKAIIGMLEVIESDFDRTVRTTEAAEKRAAAEFVEFDRSMRSDLSRMETKTQLNNEDLNTARNLRKRKTDDLETQQSLLDDALQTLEDLKPTCTDTGMSYAERVAKREEEIQALTKAYCILLPTDDDREDDADCKPQGGGQGLM